MTHSKLKFKKRTPTHADVIEFSNFLLQLRGCLHGGELARLGRLARLGEISPSFRGCSYGGELARLGGLAHLGEMIFIPRSYGIFYLSSIKKFVMSFEKDYLIK